MLNLTRGKRIFSAILVAIMLFATVFAVAVFSNTEKSNGELLLGTDGVGSSKLSADSVDTVIIYENADIFESLEIVQTDITSITVSGKVDLAEYAGVVDGDIGIRIGEDDVRSHIMAIEVDAEGYFNLEIVLNTVFCSEYGNAIPVVVSYTKTSDPANVCELSGVMGVITYDYATGALGYPAGAEYLNADEVPAALTTKYVPLDAFRDDDGKVTVMYQDNFVSFVANDAKVGEAPTGDIGSIKDVDGNKVTLNVVEGLEYAYIEVTGSITNNYGKNFVWVLAESDTLVFEDLKPDVLYTYWARTPATDDVLASAPVLVAKGETLSADDADDKKAFLDKYAEIVVNGDELYSTESPEVTADKADTAQLLSLYNALSDEVKALEVVSSKADYLVLSNYLARHQGIIAAAKDADAYADLRTDYTYNNMIAAVEDFAKIKEYVKENHLFDENDGKFVFELSVVVQKINVLLPVEVNDPAKDLKYEAVDFIIDTYDLSGIEDEDEIESIFDDGLAMPCTLAREEYEIVLFMKKYQQYFMEDADLPGSITAMEGILADFVEVDYFTTNGEMLHEILSDEFNTHLNDLYLADLNSILAKYDEEKDTDIIDVLVFVIGELREIIPSAIDGEAPTFIDTPYPYSKEYYDIAKLYVKVYDAYAKDVAALEALKNGASNEIKDIVDTYLNEVYSIYYGGFDGIGDANDPAVIADKMIADMDAEVVKANTHLAFLAKKDAAKAEIEAMKDNNQAVIDAANKYLPEIDVIEYDYNNVTVLNANIDAIVAAAKAETDFEKKSAEVKSVLAADIATRKASGRYSAAQLAQLDSYLAEAIVLVNNIDFIAGKTIADLEAQQAASLAKFASVKVMSVSAGNVPFAGDLSAVDYPADYNFDNGLWGNLTNMNGFGSALTLSMKKVDFEENKVKVNKIIVASGELTQEEAIAAAKDKIVVYKVAISLNDGATAVSGNDNGLYTVRLLVPADIREESGLYVISKDGETTYVYETTREGNYLVFKVASFTEFMVVADKTVNLTWLIVLLSVLLAVEVGVVVFFVIKKKKKGAAVASLVPFLALAYIPAAAIPAVAFLGVLTVIGATAATTTAVSYNKKKRTV